MIPEITHCHQPDVLQARFLGRDSMVAQPVVDSIPVHLQDSAISIEMLSPIEEVSGFPCLAGIVCK